jgi:SAM-dependent methyltransferase
MGLFSSAAMAEGYARARPPIHAWVVERVRGRLRLDGRGRRALDVGCGAGLSTAPLRAVAQSCLGVEPVAGMAQRARAVAPGAHFAVGRAEALPVRSGCFELITAAGSLNYVDLERFFPEARRVLAARGVLVVYDFAQGRAFGDGPALGEWFDAFSRRYPLPPASARELDPAILASLDSGFRLRDSDEFVAAVPFTAERYLAYLMSEANVPYAISRGEHEEDLRAWCVRTLAPVFDGGEHEVLFRGYFACLVPLERPSDAP